LHFFNHRRFETTERGKREKKEKEKEKKKKREIKKRLSFLFPPSLSFFPSLI